MIKMIDYGIDLGTTNSCIAKYEDGIIRIFQNNEQMNVTPSAVYIHKSGRKLIGRAAYDKIETDPENVAIEFKRILGIKSDKYFTSSGERMNPEELSAEILRALVDDVKRQSNVTVSNAVITVPAAFSTLQCEATSRAAKSAGFNDVILLQEPIAAAIAYGVKPGSGGQYWLVFDLGGGTLDIAVVSTYNGQLTVLNHEGDNYLGGKDIDKLIVNNILYPSLSEDYSLPNEEDNIDEYKYLNIRLIKIAEDVKKRLSTSDQYDVEIFDVGDDLNGNLIEKQLTITKKNLDEVIENMVNKCIKLSERAIEGAKIPYNKLSKILLVGGPTQIPYIRESLEHRFGIEIDASIDPMTVVARGAAIYASLTKISEEKNIDNVIGSLNQKITLKLEYPCISSDTDCSIAGKFIGEGIEKIHEFKINSIDGYWSSGWIKLINDKAFIIDVLLKENTENEYIVSLRDNKLLSIEVENNIFSIKHDMEYLIISEPPLPHTLSIEIINSEGGRELHPMINKNTPLPAQGAYTFKAAKTLRPRGSDVLPIKLWEGEEIKTPYANMFLKSLSIKSENIERPISEGIPIEVIIDIDKSRKIDVKVSIPKLDMFFPMEAVYDTSPIDIMEPINLIEDEISSFYAKLDLLDLRLEDEYDNDFPIESERIRREVEDIDIEYNMCSSVGNSDVDRCAQLVERASNLRSDINLLEDKVRKINADTSTKKTAEILEEANKIVSDYGKENDIQELSILRLELLKQQEYMNERATSKIIKKIYELNERVIWRLYDVWQYNFNELIKESNNYVNVSEAEYWKNIGKKADQERDQETLQRAVRNLYELQGKDINKVMKEKQLPPGLKN